MSEKKETDDNDSKEQWYSDQYVTKQLARLQAGKRFLIRFT